VNTEALCILASVAGESLTKHLVKILPALVSTLSEVYATEGREKEAYEVALTNCQGVVFAVTDVTGITIILDELMSYTKTRNKEEARAATSLLVAFCSNPKVDYSDHTSLLLRGLLQLFTSTDKPTLEAAWTALNHVTKKVDIEDQRMMVLEMRQAVKFAASDLKPGQLMPGFCLPKGIQPILPVYREAILTGEAELKELASNALSEVIQITEASSLRASVISVTGPLIRVLGDRFAANVKIAVLDTLGLLLAKTGNMLKPFLPQLQTTFLKGLHDANKGVRMKSGSALAHLLAIHAKTDTIFAEVLNSLQIEDDPNIRDTMMMMLRQIFLWAGAKVPPTYRPDILDTLKSHVYGEQESHRLIASGALAASLDSASPGEAEAFIKQHITNTSPCPDDTWHGRASLLTATLRLSPLILSSPAKVLTTLLHHLACKLPMVLQSAASGAASVMLQGLATEKQDLPPDVVVALAKLIKHPDNEVKQSMCRAVQYTCEHLPQGVAFLPTSAAKVFVPALVNGTKEKNSVVKSGAEMALVALLRLREGDQGSTRVLSCLEGGMKESLAECIQRSLRKSVYYPVSEHEFDKTMITC